MILPPNQWAFIKCKGGLYNTYVVLEIIYSILLKDKRLAHGTPCLSMQLDMAKAYDRIS